MWAARPIIVFKFLPWAEVSKFTSQRMKVRWTDDGARIWSKQLFNISRKIWPFFELSEADAGHNSILAEW